MGLMGMKNRFSKYDIEVFNQICDAKDNPNIIGTFNNRLESFWCRSFKEIIKFQTSIIIKGLPQNSSDSKGYFTNVFFDITPKQAEEIIIELEKVLKRIKKRGDKLKK